MTTVDDELNANGDCALREAIAAANLDAASTLTLRGAGAEATMPDGIDSDRVIDIQPAGRMRIEHLAIVNGSAEFAGTTDGDFLCLARGGGGMVE